MTRTHRASAGSWKPTVDWGLGVTGKVIEKRPHPQAEWHSWSFRPDVESPEGIAIDDLVDQLQAEGVDLSPAREELGFLLTEAGDVSLRSLRLRAGLSQRELGERIGMSQPNVARLERHPGDVGLNTLRRLADALGVDLNTLGRAMP